MRRRSEPHTFEQRLKAEQLRLEHVERGQRRPGDERRAEVEAERREEGLADHRAAGPQTGLDVLDAPAAAALVDRADEPCEPAADDLERAHAAVGVGAAPANHDAGSCRHQGWSRMPRSSATTVAALYPAASHERAGGQTPFER